MSCVFMHCISPHIFSFKLWIAAVARVACLHLLLCDEMAKAFHGTIGTATLQWGARSFLSIQHLLTRFPILKLLKHDRVFLLLLFLGFDHGIDSISFRLSIVFQDRRDLLNRGMGREVRERRSKLDEMLHQKPTRFEQCRDANCLFPLLFREVFSLCQKEGMKDAQCKQSPLPGAFFASGLKPIIFL